jgi:hypothetical protein
VTAAAKAFAALPPARPCCIASIAMPARDEADRIAKAVNAILAQGRLDGAPLDPDAYELLVFANGCSDETAAVVERCAAAAPQHAVYVVRAGAGAPESRHVGAARRAVMDAAAARMSASATVQRAILTTDADSVVAADWVAQNLAALRTADAVGGRIVADPLERAALPDVVRAELDAKTAYEFAVACLESAVDPLPWDPWPRHWQRCGPSLALRVDTYVRAGGLPPHERLEDLGLYQALLAVDARFRHSIRSRVVTSLRVAGRVAGGFGSEVAAMNAVASAGLTMLVEHPETTYEAIVARAALRRWWHARDSADQHEAMSLFGLGPRFFRDRIAAAPAFGAALVAAQSFAAEHGAASRRPQVAIARARAALAGYSAEARSNALRPTREMARSGAG